VQPPYNDFSVSDIEQALNQLKRGKAPGLDGIVKEHITLSPSNNYASYVFI